jgi:2-oxoglutarate ferredoxin oxidoreductase subunit alpha
MVLVKALKLSGFNVFATKEYMSRFRGGNNSVKIVVSSGEDRAFLDRIDILIPLNKNALCRLDERIDKHTVIVGSPENVDEKYRKRARFLEANFAEMAEDVGKTIYANSVAAGAVAGILDAAADVLETTVTKAFEKKGKKVAGKNAEAVKRGYTHGRELAGQNDLAMEPNPDDSVTEDIILKGAEAVSLGPSPGVSFLHLKQVFPLHRKVGEYLEKADQTVAVESNATAQLGTLLALETGRGQDQSILKYNGLPFCVEELRDLLADIG